ncbi:MAG: hypothetical protein WA004_04770 [Saprospiraceae bacterium]
MKRVNLSVFVVLLLITGCKKDDTILKSERQNFADSQTMTIEAAKSLFYQYYDFPAKYNVQGLEEGETCLVLEPIWYLAQEIQTNDSIELVTVPLHMPDSVVRHGRGGQLVFFPNGSCEFPVQLVVYDTKDYNDSRPFPINNCSFTGVISVFDFCNCSAFSYPVEDGELLGATEWQYNFDVCPSGEATIRTVPDCYNFNSGWWQDLFRPGGFFWNLWNGVLDVFSGSGGSGGTGTTWVWIGYNYGGFPYYGGGGYSSSGGGGGTGSPTQINTIFDGTFFNGEGQLVVNILEEMIAENDLLICTEKLHNELYYCISMAVSSGEIIPHPGHPSCNDGSQGGNGVLSLSSYIYALNALGTIEDCLSPIISQYQNMEMDIIEGDGMLMCIVEKINKFDVSNEDLFKYIKTSCGGDEDCINGILDCFEKLEAFQDEFGLSLGQDFFEKISSICIECNCSGCSALEINYCMLDAFCANELSGLINEDPSWLNKSIFLFPEDIPEPAVTEEDMICGLLFDFNYTDNSHSMEAAGLTNLRLRINVNGTNVDFFFPRVYFVSSPLDNCMESLSQKAADAVNQTIITAKTRIENNDYPEMFDEFGNLMPPDIRHIVYVELFKNFKLAILGCKPPHSTHFSEVKLIDVERQEYYENVQGTVFNDFPTEFVNKCD